VDPFLKGELNMKAKPQEVNEDYKPVSITITFDTYDEAQHVHDIFNNMEILSACGQLNGDGVRKAIEVALGKTSFFQTTTWTKFYERMKRNYKKILEG
jgi:hypothetical protein